MGLQYGVLAYHYYHVVYVLKLPWLPYRLPCENKIDEVDNGSKQASSGCHGDNKSKDRLNINRTSNVLCYQPLPPSDYEDEGTKTS